MTLFDAALELAGAGWSIFPLRPKGKEPLISKKNGGNGCYDGTTDLEQIRTWWTDHPGANIGCHCKGLLVLDVDLKTPKGGGLIGPDALARLEAKHGPLPMTLTSRTGTGGMHYIFALPAGAEVPNRVMILVDGQKTGLDIRTVGGYILLPPSIHPDTGAAYIWELEAPIAEAPVWLLQLLQTAPPAPAPVKKGPHPAIAEADAERAWARKQIGTACERIRLAGTGMRHEVLKKQSFWLGGLLHLLDPIEVEEELTQAGLDAGKPPKEVRATVTSGLAKGSQRPLSAPQRATYSRRPPVGEPPPPFAAGSGCGSGEPSEPPVDWAARFRAAVEQLDAAQDPGAKAEAIVALFDEQLLRGVASVRAQNPTALQAELARLRTMRGCASHADRFEKAVRALNEVEAFSKVVADVPMPAATVAEALGTRVPPDLPAGLRVPSGYLLSPSGVWRHRPPRKEEEQAPVVVALRPLLVTAVASDVEGGGSSLELRWHDGRAWRKRWVPRGTALVARELAHLAQHDLPVTSVSAAEVVRYLDSFLADNAEILPTRKTSATLGWRGDLFLLGNRVLGANGAPDIELSQDDEGIAQLAQGYRTSGSWEQWCKTVATVAPYPRVYLALAAAMVPPLYRWLPQAPNFAIDWSCKTSGGKTSALRVAASVWGYPHDEDGGIIRTWDASTSGVERLAAFSSYLPLILDDTKRVREQHPGHIQQVVYAVAQGQGRMRATITGLQKQAHWRTVLLSTGEDRLVDLAPAGGAAARTLCLWGSPFEREDQEVLVRHLREELLVHHGHLGPRLIAWLQAPGREAEVRRLYREAVDRWSARASGQAVASRAVDYLALLNVALSLAVEELGVPPPCGNPMDTAWLALGATEEDAALEVKALRLAYEWAVAHSEAFYGREPKDRDGTSRAPSAGWLGKWNGGEMWDCLCFLPDPLQQMLTRAGLQPRSIIRTWAEKGWIQKDGRNLEYPVRMQDGQRVRCVKIHRKPLETLLLLDETEDA